MSPAEFLRPFAELSHLDGKQMVMVEKNIPYELKSFKLHIIDSHKVDGRYYKESEYSGLF